MLREAFKIPPNYLKKIVYFDESKTPSKRLRPYLNVSIDGAYNEFNFNVRTYQDGFRDANQKDYDTIVLGDSQTFGIGVGGSETFSALLNGKALNTGCSGYNTIEEYQIAREVLEKYKPKRIILSFFSGNDPFENYKNRDLLEGGKKAQKRRQKPLEAAKSFLDANSAVYYSIKKLRDLPAVNDLLLKYRLVKNIPPDELEIFKTKDTQKKKLQFEITEYMILKIRSLALAHGADFWLLFIPDKLQVEADYWARYKAKYHFSDADFDLLGPNKRLNAFSIQNGIKFLDATPRLRAAKEAVYWKIDNHLNQAGHKAIADLLNEN